ADAMRRGQYDLAKRYLDDAIASIEGIFAGADKDARKSRSYFRAESKKTFLGEPYERVMAYYYRGILYWIDGEPDNARACFRSAQLQDSDTENKAYSSDYVLLDYLDGLASVKLAGDGSDAYQRAMTNSKSGPLPAYDSKANALIFIEFGDGPKKYATGPYAEQLRFREGYSEARSAVVKVDGRDYPVGPGDDLYFQATTRGGRVMDHILANKAVFKSATDTVGNVGLITGAVLASDRDTQTAGLALVAASVVTKLVAAATTPHADIRSWNNLPQFLAFQALALSPGEHRVVIEFKDGGGRLLAGRSRSVTVQVAAKGHDTVVFVSDRSEKP
ncbi:MAG: hypothetical protein H7X97_08675, partial [Opitutaceae bacterium]|nr:hypothetical protein [Verrucomicrobiales bacterium]